MRSMRFFNSIFFTVSLVFFSYLFYIQCVRHNYYSLKARNQHEKKFELIGARGNIYDRNGLALATSQPCFSVFCTPRYASDREKVIRNIAIISGRTEKEIRKLISRGAFFWVDRKVDAPKRDKYVEINDPSIGYTYDLNRQYNMPEIFSSLIGTCGADNRGIEGLELQLNEKLSGKSGFAVYQKDPTGEMFPYHNHSEKAPLPGQDVYLTIDLQMQTILYRNLKECLDKEEAKYAAGIVIDPNTGEILALVNVGVDGDKRNHVVCDEFEPGSTFKLITMTYALLDGYRESNLIDTEGGKVKVSGHTIHDFRDYGKVTFREAIAHSSNVAMVKVSREFDRETFCVLMRDFGLGQVTGIELPGETKGKVPSADDINDVEFATLVFGQGLTVNLLQLVFTYQVVANSGVLTKPLLIKEIRDKSKVTYKSKTLRIRRVVSQEIAARVTEILCGVVEEGSGTGAAIEGVRIAGKTGTAQKVVNQRYSNSSIITTFIGYLPAEDPDFLIGILFDEPQRGLWASTIAAPVFRNVAQSIYQMNGNHYATK